MRSPATYLITSIRCEAWRSDVLRKIREKTMSTWTVVGTQIQKDGQSVFLGGVCYAPTPAGAATFTPGVGDWFALPWNGIWERDLALMNGMGINNLRT